MVQGGMSVVKFLLFAFNFVFVVCGIALISVGALAHSSGREYTIFLDSAFVTAPNIIIAIGCVIFLIAFFGCCGAVKQSYCMVMTFSILLFLIFVVEITGGILAYVYRNQIDDMIKKNMQTSLTQNLTDSRKIWDEMEMKIKCCGVVGASDYKGQIPASCCRAEDLVDGGVCPEARAYDRGCYEPLKDLLKSKITMVGGAGIGIAFIEILGMIFAWCLASAIKKEYEGV